MYLVTSEEMNNFDKHTMVALHVPGMILMEHAGKAVAWVARQRQPRSVVVLCGKGNNGGDGWIAARWLKHWGVDHVMVLTTHAPEALQNEAALAAQMAISRGIPYEVYDETRPLPQADVWVDALLGTGGRLDLSGRLRDLILRVNEASSWTIAVDVPSGVSASTGEVGEAAIRADETLCMGLQKLGTAISPGCEYAGDVQVVDIGIATDGHTRLHSKLTSPDDVAAALPKRTNVSHKGTYGKVAIAVGRMTGAPVLAGLGAARVGAGLVVLAHSPNVRLQSPVEFVLREHDAGDITWCQDTQALVVGPGLGDETERYAVAVASYPRNGVLDADGLRLASLNGEWHHKDARWVLTPHPKECARLLNWSVQDVQAQRLQAAKELAARTGSIVVLKGYRSIIADPAGEVAVNTTGNAALATAGTGDVLAGMIGGLLAQGASPWLAACAGTWLHGKAGELAGTALSQVSTMASDVVDYISRAIRLHFDKDPGESRGFVVCREGRGEPCGRLLDG